MIEKYLAWEYNGHVQTCWTLARAFWLELTGVDLSHETPVADVPLRELCDKVTLVSALLQNVLNLQDPCLVLMERERTTPHIGVYYHGRILHLNRQGCSYQAPDHVTACFPHVSYYVNKDSHGL